MIDPKQNAVIHTIERVLHIVEKEAYSDFDVDRIRKFAYESTKQDYATLILLRDKSLFEKHLAKYAFDWVNDESSTSFNHPNIVGTYGGYGIIYYPRHFVHIGMTNPPDLIDAQVLVLRITKQALEYLDALVEQECSREKRMPKSNFLKSALKVKERLEERLKAKANAVNQAEKSNK